ncbi:hypothetical protein [Salinibius halmophilus]|uniref:hypothetical protein n=1 Tax=Salinibius halmophilus TaxID=1853216 RepID=UPI000E66F24A|nr:hypothetical protein [Salinibius halmophilus]
MIKRFTKEVLAILLRALVKFFLFVFALAVLSLAALAVYANSPSLANKTLPYVLGVDEPTSNVRFVQAIQDDVLQTRYGFPSTELIDIYYFAKANQLPVMHSGEKQPWLAKPRYSAELPTLAQAPFGMRYVHIRYPDECMELAVIEQRWLSYQLVLEVDCHE